MGRKSYIASKSRVSSVGRISELILVVGRSVVFSSDVRVFNIGFYVYQGESGEEGVNDYSAEMSVCRHSGKHDRKDGTFAVVATNVTFERI